HSVRSTPMSTKLTKPHLASIRRSLWALAGIGFLSIALGRGAGATPDKPSGGKEIFRFDTFGNEAFWTDTLRLHEVIAKAVDPTTALSVGLKVDAEAVPADVLKSADLKSPATTIALLKLGAVVG